HHFLLDLSSFCLAYHLLPQNLEEMGNPVKPTQKDFLIHLTRSISDFVQGILNEGSFGFFRRSPQVVLGNALIASSTDFYLAISRRTIQGQDKGTFNCPVGLERFLVFRNPEKIRFEFTLSANNLHSESRLRALDKLVSFFFDHRTIEPFI